MCEAVPVIHLCCQRDLIQYKDVLNIYRLHRNTLFLKGCGVFRNTVSSKNITPKPIKKRMVYQLSASGDSQNVKIVVALSTNSSKTVSSSNAFEILYLQ